MAIYESNADILDDNCSDIDTDWTNTDAENGASTQENNAPGGDPVADTFKFDSGSPAHANNRSRIWQDVGSFADRIVVEIKLYHSALGIRADGDYMSMQFYRTDVALNVQFATNGLYIHDGDGFQQIDATWVQTGVWQTWIFDIDFSTPATANCDIYLKDDIYNYTKVGTGKNCSQTGSGWDDGKVQIAQWGQNNANNITYIDYIKVGTDLLETTSISGTRDAIIEGKPYDDLSSILQGVTTDNVSAIMRSVITSYRGSVIKGYVHDRVQAILQGVTINNVNTVMLGVTPSFRSAILLAIQGVLNERGSISTGKPFDNIFAVLDAMIHDRRYSVVRGKTYSGRMGLVLGNVFSNIGSIIQSVLFDYRNVTIRGKSFDNIRALIYGIFAAEDDIYAIIYGVAGLDRYVIEEGKPYVGRSSVIEGHLIRTNLTFRYNINRASFDYYYALTEMASTYETEANVTFYEENSRPVYIYYGYGHEAYEYYPSTEILIPAYSNVPSDAEWEIKVYANAVDNREERNTIIKELSKVDFDGEIRSAFSKAVDQSYHTFRINLGIAGILNDVYAIMRVKSTSNRVSWILGKDYPLYIIGTDFGVYSLLTTTRRIKIAEARFAIIRGLALPYSLLYGILYGVGKAESLLEGVVKGKVFSEIWSIIEGIMSPENDEYGVIRGCTHCAVDVYSEGEAVTGGRGFVIWQGTEDSKSLNRYEEIYEGPWNPRVLIGTANEGFYITAIEDWIINNVDSLRDVLIQGVSTNNVSSILSGE